MFSTNHNISAVEDLIKELKHYFVLQKKYVTLEFVSKLVILLSTLILGTVLFLISGVALLLLAFCLSSLIADFCGSQTVGYASVAGLCVLLVIIVYCNRKRWIIAPIIRFLTNLFLTDKDEKNNNEAL